MRFSEILRQQSHDIFEGIISHPFITGIARGDVPNDALIHYVKADVEYLSAFNRLYEEVVSQCNEKKEMAFFRQYGFVLKKETHPHHNFCQVAGVEYEHLQGSPLPPTAHHYIAHMTITAQNGNVGEKMAALLPCPWTHLEIGLRIMGKVRPKENHPFHKWIRFYADLEVAEITSILRDILDEWAEKASDTDKKKAQEAFLRSAQLEYMFWEMAYKREEWPFTEEEVKL